MHLINKLIGVSVLIILACATARAETFRAYVISTKITPDQMSTINPLDLLEMARTGDATIEIFAETNATVDAPGRHDSTSLFKYVESWSPDFKQALSHTTRKVGTLFEVSFVATDEFTITFSDTRLVNWLPLNIKAGAYQPIFIQNETSYNRGYMPKGGVVVTGGPSSNDGTHIYRILQRVASEP